MTFIVRFFKKLFQREKLLPFVVVPRDQHGLSRSQISKEALKVLYRLQSSGYQAYMVGGGVRDILLGHPPKDFDIATNARPEQVRRVFRNCRLIGRRFRLAHVYFGEHIIEVATFRKAPTGAQEEEGAYAHEQGMVLRDNLYGTLQEDVFRRDFTINALYYNIADWSIIDYVGGMEDLKARRLRMIGDPDVRIQEDPVRMIRAVRFAAKYQLTMDDVLSTQIHRHRDRLQDVSPSRLYEEVRKLFLTGSAVAIFDMLRTYHLLEPLFPKTAALLHTPSVAKWIHAALEQTDRRVAQNRSVMPAFLLAAMLWPVLEQQERAQKRTSKDSWIQSAQHVILEQQASTVIPKKTVDTIFDIWRGQKVLEQRRPGDVYDWAQNPRLRAAFDFLLLRREADEALQPVVDWWQNFMMASEEVQDEMIRRLPKPSATASTPRAKKRRGPRRRPDAGAPEQNSDG